MRSNNNHNIFTANQLESIIESIRASHDKCSIKMVGERIGLSIWSTWQLLQDAGLPTRLYNQSLGEIEERIRAEGQSLTLTELYEKFGSTWANPISFHSFLTARGIKAQPTGTKGAPLTLKNKHTRQLGKDVLENGYDLSSLTREEIAEMYDLPYSTVSSYLKQNNLTCTRAKRKTKNTNAPPALL